MIDSIVSFCKRKRDDLIGNVAKKRKTEEKTQLLTLPDELQLNILGMLSPVIVYAKMPLVCKKWKDLSDVLFCQELDFYCEKIKIQRKSNEIATKKIIAEVALANVNKDMLWLALEIPFTFTLAVPAAGLAIPFGLLSGAIVSIEALFSGERKEDVLWLAGSVAILPGYMLVDVLEQGVFARIKKCYEKRQALRQQLEHFHCG